MRSRQSGVTFIGWVLLLAPVAVLVYVGLRVTPVLLNHVKVARALEQVGDEYRSDADQPNAVAIRQSIQRRFDIEDVEVPLVKDILVGRDENEWVVRAEYEQVIPLFGPVALLVTFDKRVALQ